MKKHELIKYAYDNYPKGTKCTWGGGTIVSTGVFHFENEDIKPFIYDSEVRAVYDGYKWAEIIEDRKFIIKSEDGDDLYEGDSYHRAYRRDNKMWAYDECRKNLSLNHAVVTHPDKCKAFSTKQAAEAWIAEANNPKEITIDNGLGLHAVITSKGALLTVAGMQFLLTPYQLNELSSAYKSIG